LLPGVDWEKYAGSTFQVTVADTDMVSNFPTGSKVRVFGSMNGEEIIGSVDSTVSSPNRVLTVTTYNSTTIDLDASSATLTTAEKNEFKELLVESVLVRVKDDSQPALQTIRYRINNGALERIINGDTQILARNLSAVNFAYDYSNGRVRRIDMKLTGKTRALKNDAISGEKTRVVETSVRLRNIF
jgi:hypothetical protein